MQQTCVISPVLFTLYTNDCCSQIASINHVVKFADIYTNDCCSQIASINHVVKFADDTAILRLIKNKNEIS